MSSLNHDADSATTMTMAGDTMLASTADWPSTSAPTIDRVWPMLEGARSPASRSRSKASSRIRASTRKEKGAACCMTAVSISILTGRVPG